MGRTFKVLLIIAIAAVAVEVCVWLAAIYAAAHFIGKAW